MIIKMKNVTILGLDSHTESILEELREIGVVHVRHVRSPEGQSLEELAEKIGRARAVLEILPEGSGETPAKGSPSEVIREVFELGEKKRAVKEEVIQLERESHRVDFLGAFEPEDVRNLETKGVRIRLYECTEKEMSRIPPDLVTSVVGRRGKKAVVAVASYGETREVPFLEIPIPPRSVKQIEEAVRGKREELSRLESEIAAYAPYREEVHRTLVELENQIELEKVRAGKGAAEEVVYVRGYCPVPKLEGLRKAAQENAWGLVVADPLNDEEPPTLITNPKWIRLIEPVFGITKTVPGYREFDISLWFLIFLSVFFGMLIGDAGYGLIYMAAAGFAQVKLGEKLPTKTPFYLMYVLAGCTIVWGALTGTWFGVEALARMSPFQYLIIPALDAYSDTSQKVVIHICLVIATVHLTLGHLLVAIRYINTRRAFEQFGWIAVLWSMLFAARWLVLGYELPGFVLYLLAAGVVAVLSVVLPAARGGLDVFLGIWNTAMSAVSAFADTMSYIRLFAVGLATLAVAQSFNNMAIQVGFSDVIRGFFSSLILVAGHSLNLAMGVLAVIVHGVRLNLLEFSGHLGNTWSGYEYRPFVKKSME